MKQLSLQILLTLSLTSFAFSEDQPALEESISTAINSLEKGMTEKEVLEIMLPISLDWGKLVVGGGTGASIYYFQISEDLQQPIGMNGYPEWDLHSVLKIEAKEIWIREKEDNRIYFKRPGSSKPKFVSIEEFLSDESTTEAK